MKHVIIVTILIITYTCVGQKGNESFLNVNVIDDIVIPKNYIVPKTSEEIIIDGETKELSWGMTSFSDNFIDIEGVEIPKFNTKVKMLWDNKYLYVFAELNEPHIWGNLKQRDTIIFYNNDFEVFLDPSGTGAGYGEIEINALNTVWDLYLDKTYRIGGKANFEWNLDELKSAVKIHGTLNNPNDIDSIWTVEMAIPLKPLISLKNNPKRIPIEGEQWRINFSRVEWDFDLIDNKYYRKKENNTFKREYNWVWSNQKVINMHEPEKWGFLQFTESPSNEKITFIEDIDLEVKQTLFALFRKTRFGELKYLLNESFGATKKMNVLYKKDKTIQATFFKTNFGFEYKVTSILTNKTYAINHEGVLIAF